MATTKSRCKNRRDTDGMIELARERAAKHGTVIYLVPTYYGLAFDTAPSSSARSLRIEPNGEVWQHPDAVARYRDGAKPTKILVATR